MAKQDSVLYLGKRYVVGGHALPAGTVLGVRVERKKDDPRPAFESNDERVSAGEIASLVEVGVAVEGPQADADALREADTADHDKPTTPEQNAAEADAKAKAEREAKEKAEADAKAKAEREAKEKAEADAKAKAGQPTK